MIQIDYFVRRAGHCAEKCAQQISDDDRRQSASQWHQKLAGYSETDLDMAFGAWMSRASNEKKWQLPGVTEIRQLLGADAKPRKTSMPFVKPGPLYLAAIKQARSEIEALSPDLFSHKDHKFDPMTGQNDTSKCPVCKPKVAGPRRQLIAAILDDLPTPTESLYTCRCGPLDGWIEVEGGVAPCPDCHPMGVPQ